MDRGEENLDVGMAPRTEPPASAGGDAADCVVPLPLPPRAFAVGASSDDFHAADTALIAADASGGPALDDAQLAVDEVFAQISSEASVRSATAFIEDLNHAAPPSGDQPVAAASRELSIEKSVSPPPILATPAFNVNPLQADVRWPPQQATPLATPEPKSSYRHLAWRVVKIAGMAAAAWLAIVLVLIAAYRFVNPPISALMLQKLVFGEQIAHEWVAIDNMSPNIVRAVLLSEDGRFCEHNGVDYDALQQAVEQAANGGSRGGASTISMQVIKNLFLWPSKSYVRKALEFPLTYVMEFVWPKRRIMEVYLNIAEWGPGIFGVQSAAQYHFNKTAWGLTAQEAARLAVALPNPIARDAGDPGYGTQRLAGAVQVRMRTAPRSQLACVLPKQPT